MMFSSSPLDKNCINSDSCSSSRNNAPNRFSVGIAPLADENQQIRIQLAVHKYNGTTASPFNNRCSFKSPIRHSLLKNSLKVRNYEGDCEGTSKTDSRNGNQYEGVGAFPTVHLKKNALRYRPIRRFNDVKIPYPELPVNRFLSHLPEVCPDLKSSTRSFLDVLEDLSGNKIHSKDENGCSNKPKPQGLGGDYLLNPSAVFKPLFVQKPKVNAVLTRDNTTQTLSPVSVEAPSPQGANSSQVRNGPHDPRAELRRKLAKQNNEIFASLSSSISSAFCLKRKIDKVWPSKDDGQSSEGSALKKTKMSDHRPRESNENGLAKSVVAPAVNSTESVKLSKKNKFSDANSVSPNKDRLTTIFLDTRNTSPKARVFQGNTSSEGKATEKGSQVTRPNGESADKTEGPLANSFAGGSGGNGRTQDSVNFSSSEKSDKQEVGQLDKPVVSSLTSKSSTGTKDAAESSASTLRLGVTAADTSNFSSQKTLSYPGEASKSAGSGNDLEKKDNSGNGKDMSGGFSFGKANDKPNFGPFKFGVDGGTPLPQNKVFTDVKGSTGEPAPTAAIEPSKAATQYSFAATSSPIAPPLQTSALCFGTSGSPTTFTSPGKATFTFGFTAPPTHQTPTSPSPNTPASTTTTVSSSTTTSAQTTHPATFTFGQKPIATSAPTNHVSPAATVSVAPSSNKSSWSSPGTSGPLFGSEQKPKLSVPSSTGSAAATQEQIKTSPFVFGQKETESGQKSANLFSSEQKPATQLSTTTTTTGAATPATAQTNQPFAQVVSAATTAQDSTSQASTTFGANSGFANKTASFGSSVNVFGKTTSQTTTSTSSAPAFGFQVPATTHSVSPFGLSSAAQSGSAFGSSSTAQSASGFGSSSVAQSAPIFGSSSTTQSALTFGSSSTTQSAPTFGSSSTTQSAPTFGSSSTTQSALTFGSSSTTQSASTFGSSSTTQSAPTFGSSSTTQSAPTFGSSTTQSAPTFGSSTTQSASTFGSSSSTQSAPTFGSSSTTQSISTFGSSSTTQSAPTFGSSSTTQSAPTFGSSSTTQSAPTFGSSSITQSASTFGSSSTTQSAPTFGSSSSTQSAPTFGSSSSTLSASTFGSTSTSQSAPTFGSTSTSQSAPTFGSSSTTQSITAFASTPAAQTTPAFGPPASHPPPAFVVSPATHSPPTFGPSPAFGSSTKPSAPSFGTTSHSPFPFPTSPTPQTTVPPLVPFNPSSTNTSMLFGPTSTQTTLSFGPSPGFSTPFSSPHPTTSAPAAANMFAQNPSPAFSSSNVFAATQNNVFGRKAGGETSMVEASKGQASGFGATSQVFGAQNKFSFGTSTSNATGLTTSPATTSGPMVYGFGGGTTANTFAFGGNSSGPSSTQTGFAFGSAASEPFKFGATTTAGAASTSTTATATKDGGTPFGGAASTTFSFAGQMSNPVAEQKPSFNFGGGQASSAGPGFHFGSTPSPSVFNFGGSSSSGSSGSSFNFGTPTGGVGFGQTGSPGAPFAVPGTFNIGSGSSQSRPRASSRPRRRP